MPKAILPISIVLLYQSVYLQRIAFKICIVETYTLLLKTLYIIIPIVFLMISHLGDICFRKAVSSPREDLVVSGIQPALERFWH